MVGTGQQNFKFSFSKLLENDILEKGIRELKNSFYSKTQRYTQISLRKVVSGLFFKNPGEIHVNPNS